MVSTFYSGVNRPSIIISGLLLVWLLICGFVSGSAVAMRITSTELSGESLFAVVEQTIRELGVYQQETFVDRSNQKATRRIYMNIFGRRRIDASFVLPDSKGYVGISIHMKGSHANMIDLVFSHDMVHEFPSKSRKLYEDLRDALVVRFGKLNVEVRWQSGLAD